MGDDVSSLHPVVEAALVDLTEFVFGAGLLRRLTRTLFPLRRSVTARTAEAGEVHVFNHLRHWGYLFPASTVESWARSHGWSQGEARQLAAYAAGVAAGTRYHTAPDPFGRHAIDRWRSTAGERSEEGPS